MLNVEDYKKITKFQRELLKLQFEEKLDYTFATKTLELLDDIFGYDAGVMAHLYGRNSAKLVPDFQIHNVEMDFAQAMYIRCMDEPDVLNVDMLKDGSIFSRNGDYKKTSLYRYVFKRYGYDDFLIHFLRYPDHDSYMSYIILFSRNGKFKEEDIEILREIGPSIAQVFANALKLFDANERYYVFRKAVRNLPVGIMLVERMNSVVFTNKLAAKYLKELGTSDARFYSTFYTNKVYPYYQNDVNGYKEREPIKIGGFLFKVMPVGNEGMLLDNIVTAEESGRPYSTRDIAAMRYVESVVYIVRDEMSRGAAEESFYTRYNLTNREREVAALMISGMSNSEIAERLVLSFNTVKIHVSNVYKKVGVSGRVELMSAVRRFEEE